MDFFQGFTQVELYGILLLLFGLLGRYLFDRLQHKRRKGKSALLLLVLEIPVKVACKLALLLGSFLLFIEWYNSS